MPVDGGWYFKYGEYQHAHNECWFNEERQTVLSVDNEPTYDTVRWDIHVFLQRDTPALLKEAEQAMKDAYSIKGQDAGFYLVDGTETLHQIKSADTIDGVRVTRRPYFPESRGAEGVRWRNITVSLEWREPTGEQGLLLSWETSMRVVGDGSKDWDIIPGVVGEPIYMPKTEGSKVAVIQSGRAIGLNYYPEPPIPVWTESPPFHGPSMMVERVRIPGPARERATIWQYTYFFPVLTVAPNPAGPQTGPIILLP